MNLNFEKYKVKRFLEYNGSQYTLLSSKLNAFKEPEGLESSYTLSGVYHEGHTYLENISSNGGTVRNKTLPRILCSYDHYPHIKCGMYLDIGQTRYRVNGVQDLNLLHIACDISLEEVLE